MVVSLGIKLVRKLKMSSTTRIQLAPTKSLQEKIKPQNMSVNI